MNRRQFLGRASGLGATLGLGTAFWQRALAQTAQPADSPYGPLQAPDANGLQLPAGFTSRVVASSLALVPGTTQLVIEHVLKNTGTRPISSNVYDHNFLRLTPGNDGIKVTFPFQLAAATPPAADMIRIEGNTMTYLRPMAYKERISFIVTGFGASALDYDISISDRIGAGVRMVGDQPMTRINIFSIDTTQSVEPYIAIELAPGAEKRWTYTYTFTAPQ